MGLYQISLHTRKTAQYEYRANIQRAWGLWYLSFGIYLFFLFLSVLLVLNPQSTTWGPVFLQSTYWFY